MAEQTRVPFTPSVELNTPFGRQKYYFVRVNTTFVVIFTDSEVKLSRVDNLFYFLSSVLTVFHRQARFSTDTNYSHIKQWIWKRKVNLSLRFIHNLPDRLIRTAVKGFVAKPKSTNKILTSNSLQIFTLVSWQHAISIRLTTNRKIHVCKQVNPFMSIMKQMNAN